MRYLQFSDMCVQKQTPPPRSTLENNIQISQTYFNAVFNGIKKEKKNIFNFKRDETIVLSRIQLLTLLNEIKYA